jgi:serine/threonine protein kinase
MFDHASVLEAGQRLASYELVSPLRDCQVGSAFLAVRPGPDGFQKRVVLHCADRARLEDIAAEAKRAARLSHARIAHLLDVGVHGGICYVAMEQVRGTTLRAELLRHGRLPWRVAAQVVSDVALALAYAHARRDDDGRLLGIIHGRISPGRITIEPTHSVRLTGLGVSWAWPDQLGFGAPEERRGEPMDGRADVFALGVILRRCASGEDMPERLAALIDRATRPLPEHRCTAAEMHEALAAALRDARTEAAE